MTDFPDGIHHFVKIIGWSNVVLRDIDRACAVPLLRSHPDLETSFCLVRPKTISDCTSLFVGDDTQVVPDSEEGSTGTTLGQHEIDIGAGNRLIFFVAYLNDRRLRRPVLDVVVCAFALDDDDLQTRPVLAAGYILKSHQTRKQYGR